jgi:transcriptional regulator with XRE-family HTH domain
MNNYNRNSPKKDPNNDYSYLLELLGNYIRSERQKAGFKSATSFANLIDIAESQYRAYERGKTDIKLSNLLKILKGLNKKVEDIFAFDVFRIELANFETSTNGPSLIETQVRTQVAKLNGPLLETSLSTEEIERIFLILLFCFNPRKRRDILTHLKLSEKTANFLTIFSLLITNKWLAMQFPDNPNTPKQKYYTTDAGKMVIQIT